ncbi:M23 family metallopeptidase [Oceanobacillus manasiensis]|uniref:M23 family metallopeptidase n=1 Tax=Oceanobacillus manasiensis TaxID=586413 RepID=UPI0005AB2BCC|nr:M23 family metallopeptidase [Oceanobacillus manasiensis]
MNNGVKKVRQSINQRKKARGMSTAKEGAKRHVLPVFPQDEEKHGYMPIYDGQGAVGDKKNKVITAVLLKGILSIMLFFGVALIWETNAPQLQSTKEWTSGVLTEEFPFAKVNQWYQESFGTPLALPPNRDTSESVTEGALALPVSGNVTESFQANGTGIKIAPENTSAVSALHDGVVVFAGNDSNTNKTVKIQHADGSVSTYGELSDLNVHLYQFVKNNQAIGQFTPQPNSTTLYFSIEKGKDYIDPVQVIKVDDSE